MPGRLNLSGIFVIFQEINLLVKIVGCAYGI